MEYVGIIKKNLHLDIILKHVKLYRAQFNLLAHIIN